MSFVVMKFGGTSVGTAERIRLSAQIVADAARQHRVVVVVSALSGITDLILKSVAAARRGSSAELNGHLHEIEARHEAVLNELFGSRPVTLSDGEALPTSVRSVVEQFRAFCSAVLMLRSTTPQVLDVALPIGERMSALIFAAVLQQLGLKSEFVDSARVLVTDEHFGDASPDMEATRSRALEVLLPIVKRSVVPVVTGYSGATRSGQPTTLGRGGSDSSATIFGAALGADEVWIWTDVDGVLTADPRICPGARTLPEITFREAIELSYYGAKVIHHKAIRPVMEAGIPVWIKNSFRPEVPGTRIAGHTSGNVFPVKAVTAVTPASLITLTTRRDIHFAEIFGRLFLRLGHDNVDVLFSTQSSSENSLGLVLRQQETEHVVTAIERLFRMELKHGLLDPIGVQNDIACIAVMGESMKGVTGILGRLFSAVAARRLSVIAVAQGASELNISFAVDAARAADAVVAVHEEFFTPQKQPAMMRETSGSHVH
jgi:aspartate kinase